MDNGHCSRCHRTTRTALTRNRKDSPTVCTSPRILEGLTPGIRVWRLARPRQCSASAGISLRIEDCLVPDANDA
jgi:hypothetical protein